jgi:tyrosine-specific transport protein
MMVAYISQGGQNLVAMFQGNIGGLEGSNDLVVASQVLFASVSAITLFALSQFPVGVQYLNSVLVVGVVISFLGLIGIGAPTVNMSELLNPIHQHPENVISAFPIMVLSLVYQNVVPTVVTQLECDRKKITYAIVGGTLVPLLMFLLWNGVILGNMYNTDLPGSTTTLDPVAMLQAAAASSSSLGILSNLVQIFSELAIVTSLIGFVYGLIGAWTDVLKLPSSTSTGGGTATNNDYNTLWKPLLYGAVFIPPLAIVVASKGNPDIFIQALDYGGAFGVSTLFLLLPPFMVWNSRYSDTERRKLATLPLMPGGKLALGSLWKASATLIVEQGLDKLGVLRWFHDTFLT